MADTAHATSSEMGNRRIRRRGLEEKRAQAIALIESGTSPEAVAAAFSCGRSTVYGWLRSYPGSSAMSVARSVPMGSGSPLLAVADPTRA
jgi:transposase-like protein